MHLYNLQDVEINYQFYINYILYIFHAIFTRIH